MNLKFSRADEMTVREKKLNRSRRRFLLSAFKGAAGAAMVGGAAASVDAQGLVRPWVPPDPSAD